jgi:hypothetical protein
MSQALSAVAEDDDAGSIQNNSAAITFAFQDYYRTTLLARRPSPQIASLSSSLLSLRPAACIL